MHFKTYEELHATSEAELVQAYDDLSAHTQVGLNFIRDEIARRYSERQTAEVVAMTRTMRNLTWAITGLTIVNVLLITLS